MPDKKKPKPKSTLSDADKEKVLEEVREDARRNREIAEAKMKETHKDYVFFQGKNYAVFTHRTEETILGTAWRFIMDNRKTLVLVPVQTPKHSPANPGVVPQTVEPALSALAGLAFDVLHEYHPKGTKAADIPLSEWDKYASDRLAMHNKNAEKNAFRLIQSKSKQWCRKKLSSAKLSELRDVLFEVGHRNSTQPNCSDQDLLYTLATWKEITRHDPTASIMLAYNDRMPAAVERLARQTAKAEGVTEDEARRNILDRVKYVAEMGPETLDGYGEVPVLLQLAEISVHNREDEDDFQKLELTKAERQAIEERAHLESKRRAEQNPQNPDWLYDLEGNPFFRSIVAGYAEVEFRNNRYQCPPKGRLVVKTFFDAYKKDGTTRLTQDHVLEKIDRPSGTLREAFKGYAETWKGLFRHPKGVRDVYEFLPAVVAKGGKISA